MGRELRFTDASLRDMILKSQGLYNDLGFFRSKPCQENELTQAVIISKDESLTITTPKAIFIT